MRDSRWNRSGRRARASAALAVWMGVVVLACSPRSSAVPENVPVAALPETIAPPSTKAPIDFDPSALVFGSCGEFGEDYEPGPFAVGPEVVRWAEGEPLWVMTNAGGVVKAVAGRRLDQCGDDVASEGEGEGGEREDGDGDGSDDDDDDPCVPAVAIVTTKPLVCDRALRSGIPRGLSLGDHEKEAGFLFAVPRHVRRPSVLTMRFKVRAEGVCRREDLDDDEGVEVPIKAAPIAMDRHFTRTVPRSSTRRWRALAVSYRGAPERPPVHVYYSVDGETPRRKAQWDVFVDAPRGTPTSWVRAADRYVFDSSFVRDRNCGIPYSNPQPVLAFVDDGRVHWVTVDVANKIVARIWRFDSDALTPIRTLSGILYSHYF